MLNRLEEVDNQAYAPPETHGYTCDDVGNLETVSYANGVTHTYTYNTLNRLTNLAVTDSIAQVLQSHAYMLNDVGHRTKVEEANGRVVDYEYDNLYRLTKEVLGGTLPNLQDAIEYTYDNVGNRLTRTSLAATLINQNFGYDLNDRLNTDTYDDNGNTLTSTNGGEGVTDIYNFMDKLIRRVTTGGTVIDVIYDAKGTCIRKSVTPSGSVATTTNYLVDVSSKATSIDSVRINTNNHTGYVQVVEDEVRQHEDGEIEDRVCKTVKLGALWAAELQQDGSYNVLKSYAYGHDLISVDQLVGASWELSYHLYDGHGNLRGLTDALGAITDTYIYDAFGNLIDSTGTTSNAYLYTGEQYDFDLGMYFLRARYYNPEKGRFHTMDLFEGFMQDPMSLHKYLYAHANPVSGRDPSGLLTLGEKMAVVGVVGTFANIAITGHFFSKIIDSGGAIAPSGIFGGFEGSFSVRLPLGTNFSGNGGLNLLTEFSTGKIFGGFNFSGSLSLGKSKGFSFAGIAGLLWSDNPFGQDGNGVELFGASANMSVAVMRVYLFALRKVMPRGQFEYLFEVVRSLNRTRFRHATVSLTPGAGNSAAFSVNVSRGGSSSPLGVGLLSVGGYTELVDVPEAARNFVDAAGSFSNGQDFGNFLSRLMSFLTGGLQR